MSTKRYIKQPGDLLAGEHCLILTFREEYIEGDERSRTHPGHGYPGGYQTSVTCTAYKNREDWEKEIQTLSGQTRTKDWVALIGKVPEIVTKTVLQIQ